MVDRTVRSVVIAALMCIVLVAPGARAQTVPEATLNPRTADVVWRVEMLNLFAVEAANLATVMSKNEDVKEFARQSRDLHKELSADMKQALLDSGVGAGDGRQTPDGILPAPLVAAIPGRIGAAHQMVIGELRTTALDSFAAHYLDTQVTAYRETLAMLEGYLQERDDPELEAFVNETVPILRRQMERAMEIGLTV